MREIILDTETTGLNPRTGDRVVEIGCVELVNHMPTGQTYQAYLNRTGRLLPKLFLNNSNYVHMNIGLVKNVFIKIKIKINQRRGKFLLQQVQIKCSLHPPTYLAHNTYSSRCYTTPKHN